MPVFLRSTGAFLGYAVRFSRNYAVVKIARHPDGARLVLTLDEVTFGLDFDAQPAK